VTKVNYMLTGCANGHPVRIEGKGTVGTPRLRLAFTVTEAPSTFDANLAHFAGIDAVVALADGLAVPDDAPVVARSRAEFLTEGGIEVGTIAALVTIQSGRGGIRVAAELAEGHMAMEPWERVAGIGVRVLHAVQQDAGVVVLSAGTVSTTRGHQWTVVITTMLLGSGGGESSAATVQAVHVPGQRD
jgi:hypothetical protein